MISELIMCLLLIIGSLFIFIAALGIWNLPDLLCRSHALSKALCLGISLILTGAIFFFGNYAIGLKCFLAIIFQFITIPISTHIFALYAYKHQNPYSVDPEKVLIKEKK